MIWWCHCSTHGEREGKPLEGRAAAAHVDCCVLCGCVLCCARVCTLYLRGENMHFLCGANKNVTKTRT